MPDLLTRGDTARMLFKALWGEAWRTKAAAFLDVDTSMASKYAMGHCALPRRSAKILETYAAQKHAARSQGIARAMAAAQRKAQAEYDAIATVRQTLKAMAAQDARQSAHKRKGRPSGALTGKVGNA